jgi:hypothetical protein
MSDDEEVMRLFDVETIREAVLANVPDVGPIETREYGCREIALTDPVGHVLEIGECG